MPAPAPVAVPGPDLPAPYVPTLGEIFGAFAKIGVTSFGGGLSGWTMREFVMRRRWIGEDEFLNGLALAQSFPGVNVVNIAIWLGYRLRGSRGALAGAVGITVPPMVLAILVGAAFSWLGQSPPVHAVLGGMGAAAVGLSMQMGFRAARKAARQAVPAVIMALTFVGIFLLRWPLLAVVAVMAPISIVVAWQRIRREDRDRRESLELGA
ncbi:MAG: chromate transporter [Pseudomonadota bacterium]